MILDIAGYDRIVLPDTDHWTRLLEPGGTNIVYGTGNGADKILDEFERRGIAVSGIFASDGFVRNRTFRGFPVMSYDDIIKEFGDDITVVVTFGSSLPDVISRVRELSHRHELVIPDVPLYGGDIFDLGYVKDHLDELTGIYGLLADRESKDLYTDMILYRLTGKMEYLERCSDIRSSYREFFGGKDIRAAVDGGAFRGDTAEDLAASLKSLEKVYAFEPDERNYRKLCEREIPGVTVVPFRCALSDVSGKGVINASGSRGAGEEGRNRRSKKTDVEYIRLDDAVKDKVGLIKLDVEGMEMKALTGAGGIISEHSPDLAVSLYHRTNDVFEIPYHIHDRYGKYRFYLRRPECFPMWDLNLYALGS